LFLREAEDFYANLLPTGSDFNLLIFFLSEHWLIAANS